MKENDVKNSIRAGKKDTTSNLKKKKIDVYVILSKNGHILK